MTRHQFYPFPESFEEVPAGKIRVGDRTRFSYGRNVSVRTVSDVRNYDGVVQMWHKETDPRFYTQAGETFPVPRLIEGSPSKPSPFDEEDSK